MTQPTGDLVRQRFKRFANDFWETFLDLVLLRQPVVIWPPRAVWLDLTNHDWPWPFRRTPAEDQSNDPPAISSFDPSHRPEPTTEGTPRLYCVTCRRMIVNSNGVTASGAEVCEGLR